MSNPKTISTSEVSVQNISSEKTEDIDLHPGLISVICSYPEGYAGQRHLQEGKTYLMSQESADLLISKGIALLAKSVDSSTEAHLDDTTVDLTEKGDESIKESTSKSKNQSKK